MLVGVQVMRLLYNPLGLVMGLVEKFVDEDLELKLTPR